MSRWIFMLLIVGLLVACGGAQEGDAPAPEPDPEDSEISPEALASAREVADALGSELVTTLVKELAAGGPAQAINVCREMAPEIAAKHSTDGVQVRRVSLKYRNPADAPDDFEAAKLEELEAAHANGELPEEVVEIDGQGRMRYLRPIVVKTPCLKCHGDAASIDPAVREILDEHYPDDLAVGYQAGDLRGAISIVVDPT
jgi:hypothetical protein